MRIVTAIAMLLALAATASAKPTPVGDDLLALSQMQAMTPGANEVAPEATKREAQYLRATPPGYSGQIFACRPEREVFFTARLQTAKSCD